MCGIAGLIDLRGHPIDPTLLKSMTDAIRHRGPDDEGYVLIDRGNSRFQTYAGPESNDEIREILPQYEQSGIGLAASIGLSHRRFSIIDLTSGGHQPMFAQDESCSVVHNGEIFNYVELRAELEKEGVCFRTHSDTEVLLEAYKAWGIECFKRFNGFWALALYDFRTKQLILSRDRLGKRPLYWARSGSLVYFASEIKSLLRVPELNRNKKVNETAAWFWCTDGLRDLEHSTFFEGIYSLPAASWTIVDENFPDRIHAFWRVSSERQTEKDIEIPEAVKLVRETLEDAVRIRRRADVPIAFELSGGLDSSTLLALSASNSNDRITTYTVKFSDPKLNEEPFARSVANRYNVDYRVIEPELDTFWHDISAFTLLQEEPYHSPNLQVSQVIWSLMRREGTKVALTGASGDEMFAGYSKYYWRAQIENLKRGYLRHFVDNALHWSEQRHSVLQLSRELVYVLGIGSAVRRLRRHIKPLNNQYLIGVNSPENEYYASSLTEWLHSDITNTLIPYWLRSGDKTLMGLPFEARCPFLDYRLVDIATRLPTTYLLRHGWHKWILRKAMEDLLPKDVVWRKVKMGLPYPEGEFFVKYREIIDLILTDANNPYIDFSMRGRLKTDWKAISFILWYEYFFNENFALFKQIENMVTRPDSWNSTRYQPEFLNCSN